MADDQHKVYLDHHIKRENLRYRRLEQEISVGAHTPQPTLRLVDLTRTDDNLLFTKYLVKPDFQRATWAWTADDCVSLLESIIHYHVVPSIILWKSPDNNLYYILDGGHRISVVLAWLQDNWGADQADELVDPEQGRNIRAAATEVRKLVKLRIGAFEEYRQALDEMKNLIEQDVPNARSYLGESKYAKAKFLQSLREGDIAFNILWVSGDYKIAERSFLKINKSGKELSDWEIKLVDNRDSSFARAVMSITTGTSARYYWPDEAPEGDDQERLQAQIEETVQNVDYMQRILFQPPRQRLINKVDQPFLIADAEQKPFYVAELLTLTEGFRGQRAETEKLLEMDKGASPKRIIENGHRILTNLRETFDHLVGSSPKSLEIIPLLYFYKSGGIYIRSLLYGFLYWLRQGTDEEVRLRKEIFSVYRGSFEFILRKDKDALVTALARNIGSGPEVTGQTASYYQELISLLIKHKNQIEDDSFLDEYEALFNDVTSQKGKSDRKSTTETTRSRLFTVKQRNIAVADALLDKLLDCEICGGKLDPAGHIQHDHIVRHRDEGATSPDNQRITHPFCNNVRDQIETIRANQDNIALPISRKVTSSDGVQQLLLFDDSIFHR